MSLIDPETTTQQVLHWVLAALIALALFGAIPFGFAQLLGA